MADRYLNVEFERATSLRDSGDLSGARSLLARLAVEFPGEFGVWLVLGGVQMDMNDSIGAEQSLSMATALAPSSELASLALFFALKNQGKVSEAFAEMRRFLALRPESHEYDRLLQEMHESSDGVES